MLLGRCNEKQRVMIKELVFTVGNNVRLAYQFNDFRSSHPIILALHGAAGHPLPFRRISGIDGAVSGFASVIFLAAERHGRVARWSWQKLDDRDFLLSVIDKIVGQGARTEDIYLIGMSNGGCLAHVFASTCVCKHLRPPLRRYSLGVLGHAGLRPDNMAAKRKPTLSSQNLSCEFTV